MTIIEAIKKALKEQGVSESYAERVQKAFGVNIVDGVAAAVKTLGVSNTDQFTIPVTGGG